MNTIIYDLGARAYFSFSILVIKQEYFCTLSYIHYFYLSKYFSEQVLSLLLINNY